MPFKRISHLLLTKLDTYLKSNFNFIIYVIIELVMYMANIYDYIKWRGDLTFKKDPFNEIDGLILSRFSYLPLEKLIREEKTITIEKLNKKLNDTKITTKDLLWKDDELLLPELAKTNRFKNIRIKNYVNKVSKIEEKQFSAVTLFLPNNKIFISYRGTDNTIVGWKEDLNMFFKSNTPSEVSALNYLEDVASTHFGKIILGGHSKGGTLAMYAGILAKPSTKKRIIKIYNNDGPGLPDEIIETDNYSSMVNKIETFIPQDSVFGLLLNHKEKSSVVKSTAKGLLEHDIYSWQIAGKNFIKLENTTEISKLINKMIKNWFKDIDPEKREKTIEVIFEVIFSTNIENFRDLKKDWFNHAKTILNSYKGIDNETKKIVLQVLKDLIKIATGTFINNLKER